MYKKKKKKLNDFQLSTKTATAILKPYLFSHYVCVYVFVYLF